MAMTLHVDIVSAEKELFSGAAEMVTAPGVRDGLPYGRYEERLRQRRRPHR